MTPKRAPGVSWLERSDGTGRVTGQPNRDEVAPEIDESLIVAFYSRR